MVRNVRNAVRLWPMDADFWGHATWPEMARLGLGLDGGAAAPHRNPPSSVVALLPVGAVEAHGPHLPLETDVTIATAAAVAATVGLSSAGLTPLVLPALSYSAAPFAAGFPGTLSVRPSTVAALIEDLAASLERQGARLLVLVNAHLDPSHIGALTKAADRPEGTMPVLFPDISRRPWALRLTDEFKSGACHAGRYETSVVMATTPELVRESIRVGLPEWPVSLSEAIREGHHTFEEAGIAEAYCGAPADASVAEGRSTIEVLGGIVVDAVTEVVG